MNSKVDEFINNAKVWQEEFSQLRSTVLNCGLTEELKWGKPCYSFENNNIVIIQGFKQYCALLFVKGSLLKDEKGILIRMTENTQAARQLRFTHLDEIIEMESVIKAYILEAVEIEKAGLKVDFKETKDFTVPEEFQVKLDEEPALKTAFEALTPGRQRAYLLYFSGAKQSKTRAARVDKFIPQILEGKGLNDQSGGGVINGKNTS